MRKLLTYLVAVFFMAGIGVWTLGGTALAIGGAGVGNNAPFAVPGNSGQNEEGLGGEEIANGEDLEDETEGLGTVAIGSCDSGVVDQVLEVIDESTEITISDLIDGCYEGAQNHGHFVSCVARITNGLMMEGVITGAQKGAIQACAANSENPEIEEEECEEGDDCSGDQPLTQTRHQARYRLADDILEIPCLYIGAMQFYALELKLQAANSLNLHFKIRNAALMTDSEVGEIEDPNGTCGTYDVLPNTLTLPGVELGGQSFSLEMELMSVQATNLHFKLKRMQQAN